MATDRLHHAALKTRQRAERDGWHENLSLRVHRALSWLDRAERCGDDADGRLVFLWIAFNAAYGTDLPEGERSSERARYTSFLRKLCDLDAARRLDALTWSRFPGPIRLLLGNRYAFQPFWDFQAGRIPEAEWRQRFRASTHRAHEALGRQDTVEVLDQALSRLYTLRNQLMHGGATWNSRVNRDQIRDGSALLGDLVPEIVTIMMDHPDTLWGDPAYPVVG